MARQTSFTSFNKRPRSIRLVLTELFSGRVSARLTELEERVFELEKRINAQATEPPRESWRLNSLRKR
ncbi:hypothetical protein ICF61_005004 [Escherichia coli]|nr:hypothetical protein [Escherichia coli]